MPKKKIGIVGATGFTGAELVRILIHHPEVELSIITSESRAGESFADVHPFFMDIVDIQLQSVDALQNYDLDIVFLALPHGVSMRYVEQLHESDFKIIDLSGDFRLDSPATYEGWYHKKHTFHQGFEKSAYGLPELYTEQIKAAKIIANPGCFPTSALLGSAPLLANGWADASGIIVDAKTGITGAGVKSKPVNHYSSVNENIKAYKIKNHRHTIEIEGKLNELYEANTTVQFTPHLLAVDRGILSTIYARPKKAVDTDELQAAYEAFYSDAPFVRLREQSPTIKDVRGTNYCDVHVTYDERTNNIIAISAIDNLVKGAAGQAVQNMNILLGWDETLGLNQVPLRP